MHALGHWAPSFDTYQDYESSFTRDGDDIVIKAVRALETPDSVDYVIPLDEVFDVGFAYNLHTPEETSYHHRNGAFKMIVNSDGSPSFVQAPSSAI